MKGKEFPKEIMDVAQKCGVTVDELNCIKAVPGYTIKNVQGSAKCISEVLKKLKEDELKNQKP